MLILNESKAAALLALVRQAAAAASSADVAIELDELPTVFADSECVRVGVWVRVSNGAVENLADETGEPGNREWEGEAVDCARFEQAPCYICGYDGAGYFQSMTHHCAAGYHLTRAKLGRVDQA